MLKQFLWRVAIPYSLLILIVTTGLGLYLGYFFRQIEISNLQTQMQREARLLSLLTTPLILSGMPSDALQTRVEQWGETTGSRITVIAADGMVLADSQEDARTMENHLDRPEVQQAIDQGAGQSIRFSRTQGTSQLYYSVPVKRGDQTLGVIRLSVPMTDLQAVIATQSRTIFTITLILSISGIILAVILAHLVSRPVKLLSQEVQKNQSEDSTHVEVPAAPVELGQVARAINDLKVRLLDYQKDIDDERRKLSAVLDQMTDGVILVDGQGRVQLINPVAEKFFGVSEEQAIHRSAVQVLRHHQIIDLWRQCTTSGNCQAVYVESTTQRLILHGIAARLEGEFAGYILLVFQDVTRLRQLETVRRDFISNVSHELRTPLASLKAISETLQDGALEDPQAARRFLASMEKEVDALSLMVQELVELSRIESGKVPLQLIAAHPEELIKSAVERLSLQAERAELDIMVDCPPELPMVLADPSRMEQVIVNLLHNAIKFTPPGGKILLSAREESETVIFSIEDNGSGIPEDDLPRIFERFYKADRARSGGGTGLGLAIARHLVEAHAGHIWAESVEGQGSTFYFSLPEVN